jgi:hypothetical protein
MLIELVLAIVSFNPSHKPATCGAAMGIFATQPATKTGASLSRAFGSLQASRTSIELSSTVRARASEHNLGLYRPTSSPRPHV